MTDRSALYKSSGGKASMNLLVEIREMRSVLSLWILKHKGATVQSEMLLVLSSRITAGQDSLPDTQYNLKI